MRASRARRVTGAPGDPEDGIESRQRSTLSTSTQSTSGDDWAACSRTGRCPAPMSTSTRSSGDAARAVTLAETCQTLDERFDVLLAPRLEDVDVVLRLVRIEPRVGKMKRPEEHQLRSRSGVEKCRGRLDDRLRRGRTAGKEQSEKEEASHAGQIRAACTKVGDPHAPAVLSPKS